MNKLLVAIIAGLATLAGTSAQAQEHYAPSPYGNGMYFGGSIGQLIYSEDGLDTMRPAIIEARLGQDINRYLAIEGRFGTGFAHDVSHGAETSAQLIYGGYVKGILPLTPVFSAYGLAGIGGAELHHNYPEFSTTDTGFSFGIGGEFRVGHQTSLTLEWLRLTTGNNAGFDYSADQFTFGVNWHF